MKGSWKKIGIVGKAHGLRGAFFIGGRRSLLPNTYHEVVVGDDPHRGLKTEITTYQIAKDRVLLTLSALPDRTRVNFFAGQALWVAEDSALIPYDCLVGRPVVDCRGEYLGDVVEFFNYGAADTVQIIARDTQRTLEIPFVDSYFTLASPRDESAAPLSLCVPSDTFTDLWE